MKYDGRISEEVARYALDLLEVDKKGLDRIDREILLTMMDKFEGRPVGIDTIATTIGEDSGTVEDVYEPYLVQSGFILRTARGRMLTADAYRHFGRIPVDSDSNHEES